MAYHFFSILMASSIFFPHYCCSHPDSGLGPQFGFESIASSVYFIEMLLDGDIGLWLHSSVCRVFHDG